MAEVRSSSYNHVVQTPRIGGCTGAFFSLFDWNGKRFASTKRLPAERLEKAVGRSKSFRDDRSVGVARGCSPSAKTLSLEMDVGGHVSEDDAMSRPPGLVARLMGLDSLPEPAPVSSRVRRSRSFSPGSELASQSEREKLALRDLLKQEHESFESFCAGELAIVPVEYPNQQERQVRKAALQTPIKTLVPYVDSPTGSCRSVYALPYVHKGEKSPFLARLHPSPVLQPSKYHNRMVSPAKTSPCATKKVRASRFLEAAVKILEEISDSEQCLPSEREGMRSMAEFAASSPPSSGTDLLHCRSMSKIWNESDDTESVVDGSRSNRSLSRGCTSFRDSFRDSQRRNRLCRDIFETSLSERAQSVSPPPRRPRTKAAATSEQKGSGTILRTQEAAVGDFKTDVRKALPGVRKTSSETNSMSSVRYSQQTAAPARRTKARAISHVFEGNDSFTSEEESLTDQLVRLASTQSKTLQVSRSTTSRKSSRKGAMPSSVDDFRVNRNSKKQIRVRHEEETAPPPQLRTRSSSAGLHDGLRPIKSSRNRGGQQENTLAVTSTRASSTNASTVHHSRQSTGHMDELKLPVRVKREKQSVRAAATESPAVPAVQCLNASPLKRSRRKSRHGSPKRRESSDHSRPPLPNLNGERGKEAKNSVRNSTREKDSRKSPPEQAPVVITIDDAFSDIPSPDPQSDGHEGEMVDVNPDSRDENRSGTGDSALLHGHEEVEQVQGPARDVSPSPEVAAECSNSNELLILGMDDLHWDDETLAQRGNSSRARYCEIRASGESFQSICGPLDEDVCNVDDGSSPSLHKLGGECSEADALDEISTPILMKRFLGKRLRLDVDIGETSPVSVLDSPFGDEVCTTSESSIAELERQQADTDPEQILNLSDIVNEIEHEIELEEDVATSPIDRVRQAILDISSFRSLDHKFRANFEPYTQRSPPTEKTFVREVLSAAQLLSSPGRSPNWYERDLAVDPSLFEKLEAGDAASADASDLICESGGMWRCDRKLLFDCVNEAFSQNARHFKDPQPWLRRPLLRTRSVRQKLVEEVQEKITGWRSLASHAIDTLIDIDMSTRLGKWTDFTDEVAEVGAEIERMVWHVMVDEFVLDLSKSSLPGEQSFSQIAHPSA